MDRRQYDRESAINIMMHNYRKMPGSGGILDYMREQLGFEKQLSLKTLVFIAQTLAHMCSKYCRGPGRAEKRNKESLVIWFNKYAELFRPLIPRLVIEDANGKIYGIHKQTWEEFKEENRDFLTRAGE